MNINSVLSTITNRALIGLDLISTPSFLESFFASASSSPIITLMSTFLLLSFANVSLNIFCFLVSSKLDEVRWTVFELESITDFIWR